MGGPFKALGSIFAATVLCLVAGAAQAQDSSSGEIIETDFLSAPLTDDGPTGQSSVSGLPDSEASLQAVPVEVIGGLPPAEPPRQQERSSDRDVAGADGPSGGGQASGGDASGSGGSGGSGDGGSGGSGDGGSGGSGDGGSGDGGSGDGGSGDGGSGDGGSGGSGGGKGKGGQGGGGGGGGGKGKNK
ncbi:MAG: hypothetical protein R3285_09750 [Kiloniellales bacterium]|nr:hypothetical protein [Kiloniellales bacterium]